MKVKLVVVPPGGGETDFFIEVEMPAIPSPGDYVNLNRTDGSYKDEMGLAHYIVRRTWWDLEYDGKEGRATGIAIEVEFAKGPTSSVPHKKSIEMYEQKGKKVKEFENTVY